MALTVGELRERLDGLDDSVHVVLGVSGAFDEPHPDGVGVTHSNDDVVFAIKNEQF